MYRLYFPRLHVWSKSNDTFEQLSTAPKKDPQHWDFARELPNDVFAHCRKLPSSPGESKSEGYQWPFHLFFLVHQIYVQKCCGLQQNMATYHLLIDSRNHSRSWSPIQRVSNLIQLNKSPFQMRFISPTQVLHHGLHSWPGQKSNSKWQRSDSDMM